MDGTIGDILRGYLYEDIQNQGKLVLERLQDYENQVETVLGMSDWKNLNKIYVCGCGDSYYAGEAAREAFYRYGGVDLVPSEAYEFATYEYRRLERDDLVIGVSVSGKVGTSLNCLSRAGEKGLRTLGINNCRGSAIWEMADGVVDIRIPTPEEGPVPQTCHYLANLTVLFLLALRLGRRTGRIDREEYEAAMEDIRYNLTVMGKNAACLDGTVKEIAKKAVHSRNYVVTGHGVNLATARFAVAKLHEAACQGHIVQETEEWAHEERQMTGRETYTFVLATGEGKARAAEILGMIESFGSHGVALYGQGEEQEVRAEYSLAVKMANNEAFSPMSLKLPMELFAYHISELLKVCPFHFDDAVQTRAVEKLIYKEKE